MSGSTASPDSGIGPFGRRLSQSEAYAHGYRNVSLRRDDGTVQSMETRDGYLVTYGAPSYSSAVERADRNAAALAQGTSVRMDQDAQRLEAKPAGPTPTGDAPNTGDHHDQ